VEVGRSLQGRCVKSSWGNLKTWKYYQCTLLRYYLIKEFMHYLRIERSSLTVAFTDNQWRWGAGQGTRERQAKAMGRRQGRKVVRRWMLLLIKPNLPNITPLPPKKTKFCFLGET
jgi:hypothetical protein